MTALLITRDLPDAVLDRARGRYDVTLREAALGADDAASALMMYDAILPTLGDRLSAEAFAQVPRPRTRILANFGVGTDHIDHEAAASAGIVVANTPGAVTDATADIAVCLILMACRRAGEGERIVRAGRWEGWQPTQFLGTHVTGKTVGIVGLGRIGGAVARRMVGGFGCEILFHNRSRVDDPPVPARQAADLDELLQAADIVVITVPATPQTRHMIDAAALERMKPGAFLINVARGDIVDEAALVAALRERRIAGAGLDVYEDEPRLASGLADLENVALLPHLGTAALEVREAMGMMALDNIDALFDGATVPNRV